MLSRAGSRATRNSFCWKNPILQRVSDPAAGSGAIEALTSKLCTAAWAQFQEIEAAGGAWAALERGLIQRKSRQCAPSVKKPPRAARTRSPAPAIIPICTRSAAAVLDVAPRGAAEGSRPSNGRAAAEHPAGRTVRKLRDASDRTLAKTGARPKVFLANLGKVAGLHGARNVREKFLRGRRHRGEGQ